MEWLSCIRESIEYMEDRLTDIRSPEEVAAHVNMSCMYLQKGFQILTGYSLGEYIRNRRLYLAALELIHSGDPIINIALKYGYETPASFDKAFCRFHGATPTEIRKGRGKIRSFLRLQISVSVKGGRSMEFHIEKKDSIQAVGFQRVFDSEDSYVRIPKYWDEITDRYAPHLMKRLAPEGETEEYISEHHIGELGICIDDLPDGKFHYMIAGYYTGGPVPDGMTVRTVAGGEWAVFDCTMANLQDTNTAIWKEWLPGNNEYELAGGYCVEWYSPESETGPSMRCQIWIPVKRKQIQL